LCRRPPAGSRTFSKKLRFLEVEEALSVPQEKDLVERCRKGDDEAWREMVDHLGQRVYSVAYHFSLKREDAEELSQEIFLKIFENLHRYDGSYPLVAWVVSLGRNLCIDRYRRKKRERSFRFVSDEAVAPLLQSSDDPAAQAIQKERTKLLFWALSEIPEDLAEILVLRDLEGLAYDEIGKALDLPDGTVKSRLFRARAEVARKVRERNETSGTRAMASLAVAVAGFV
jgi:RNA polymerase sigma-70 factor (ECF subfamily)